MKLAFVVQRYGTDIAGGAETHCRELAERLSPHHNVIVLTTCARDYVTWANAVPAGDSVVNGVRVRRFPVRHERNRHAFTDLTDRIRNGDLPRAQQDDWFRANGPDAPALLEHLRAHANSYDLVLFWAFRYAPTYFGLPLVADRAVLVPTAEDDFVMHLDVLQEYLRKPAGYLFLTPEEDALVRARAGHLHQPSAVIGFGLEPASGRPDRQLLERQGIPPTYVLYLGRVDRSKGCDTLLEYFQQYAESRPDCILVLAGPTTIRVPRHPAIRALGYVPDDLRRALLAHAKALVMPSPYESLSIVLLESWNYGVPAVVNADCAVLRGQVTRANGGLYYRTSREFGAALDYLLHDEHARLTLGQQGLSYVDREYRWEVVLARVEQLLAVCHTSTTMAVPIPPPMHNAATPMPPPRARNA